MATWKTPKTNWISSKDASGNYTGDYFNAVDYNRIRNNLVYLKDLANTKGLNVTYSSEGTDVTYSDWCLASTLNILVNNVLALNTATYNYSTTGIRTYTDGGYAPTAAELNAIEALTLKIYNALNAA